MSHAIPPGDGAPRPPAPRVTFRQVLPNIVTILSICAGVTGIRFAFEGRFELADNAPGLIARIVLHA